MEEVRRAVKSLSLRSGNLADGGCGARRPRERHGCIRVMRTLRIFVRDVAVSYHCSKTLRLS
jgi:hypothetical protein